MLPAARCRFGAYNTAPPAPPAGVPILTIGNTNLRVQSVSNTTTTFTVLISRGGKLDAACSVPWSWTSTLADAGFSGGSPTKSGTASFVTGDAEETVSIVLAAQSAGADKSLTFVLGAPTGGLLGTPSSAVFTLAMPLGAPVARDDTAACVRRTAGTVPFVDIRATANDADTAGAVLSLGSPSAGTVAVNDDGTIRYTAANSTTTGTATFTYTLTRNGSSSTATVTVTISNQFITQGVLGAGVISGYRHYSGCWWNGADPESFGRWRDQNGVPRIDAVTQSFRGLDAWWQHGGYDSDAAATTSFNTAPGSFVASSAGVLGNANMRSHVWGSGAAYARARRIHLAWMDSLPKNNGNAQGATPISHYNLMTGAGDKYYFLLGRNFAKWEQNCGIPLSKGLTLDFMYEFSNNGANHPDFPGGYYTNPVTSASEPAYVAFARGWLRAVKAIKQGYLYQAGTACPYDFCWRPQQNYHVKDSAGNYVPYKNMFPNDYSSYTIGADVVINGVTVLPAGQLGRQCTYVAMSMHDAAYTNGQLTGYQRADSNSNWALQDAGAGNFWGLRNFLDWARSKGDLKVCFPEWAPWGSKTMDSVSGRADASYFPAGYCRFMFEAFADYLDVLAYETYFQTGDYSSLTATWDPPQPSNQKPGDVYKSLIAGL